MPNTSLKALLVADGSGGHLIPALQTARAIAEAGGRVRVWYALRAQTAPLAQALSAELRHPAIEIDAVPLQPPTNPLTRLSSGSRLWRRAERCFESFEPEVVVGFGGWISAPVVMAARLRRRTRIACMIHEQNVMMGRANRWLARWVDRIAVSFDATRDALNRESVVTGLPVRERIGSISREDGARRLSLDPSRFTILVLGGSQGARVLNRLMKEACPQFSPEEQEAWQILHVAGPTDVPALQETYRASGIRGRAIPFVPEMDAAYAAADLVVSRSGASTVAELARCGLPAVLIPYPHANGHQRANADLVERTGGGFAIEEAEATPGRVLYALRWLAADSALRQRMGARMRRLDHPDAAERLRSAITDVARAASAKVPPPAHPSRRGGMDAYQGALSNIS
jgi:UDP-N-acetylglucosamine--N-acetylmuramyl-(pentapeptide) pyrophosphoryl-undecaprenol N-acetylglucosamine transferase